MYSENFKTETIYITLNDKRAYDFKGTLTKTMKISMHEIFEEMDA